MERVSIGIVDSVTKSRFRDEFQKIRPNQFSYEGLEALYDWLEDYCYNEQIAIEFDPIAISCDFTEYESFKQFQEDYDNIIDFEDLEQHTTVIRIEGSDGFIIQAF